MRKDPVIAGKLGNHRILLISAAASVAASVGSLVGGIVIFLVVGLGSDIESLESRIDALSVQLAQPNASTAGVESEFRKIKRGVVRAESRAKDIESVRGNIASILKSVESILDAMGRAISNR